MTLMAFQYAVVRAVPRIDRGEMINIGVIMYCQQADFLRASMIIDDVRLRALDADVDLEAVQTAAQAIVEACGENHGSARKNDGLAARFGMVTAPRSTVVQPSLIHAGRHSQPAAHPGRPADQAGGSGSVSHARLAFSPASGRFWRETYARRAGPAASGRFWRETYARRAGPAASGDSGAKRTRK